MTGVELRTLDGPHGPLPIRIYQPATPTGCGLVWLHGGAFFGGDLDMPEADLTSRRLADHGITVVSVGYQLAPISADIADWTGLPERGGAHFPIAHDEVRYAFAWALQAELTDGAWALGGASAGGNLAVGAALTMMHTEREPALVVLAYPTLHYSQPAPDSALQSALDANPIADMFGPAVIQAMYENYVGTPLGRATSRAVPGLAGRTELVGFPPVVMVTSHVDDLRVSAELFARELRLAGVEVDSTVERGTFHGYLNDPLDPSALTTVKRFAKKLTTLTGSKSFAESGPCRW